MTGTAKAPPRLYSVVMPAFNEEGVLEDTLRALDGALAKSGLAYEVLVSNDGSTDGTERVLERLEVALPHLRHVTNLGPHGYGHAVRYGLAHYRGDAVVVVMADGSDAPADVIVFFERIREGYDCAFGSRFIGNARVTRYPWLKLVFNRLGNALISRLVGQRYDDFTNGFKCFRRPVIDGIQPLICGGFNLTVEMSIKAVQNGASFCVVPTHWTQRASGVSKFSVLRQAWHYLLTVAYCLIGHYLARGGARR